MVLVLTLPDLDPSSMSSSDSPPLSPSVPVTPSPTSLAFSPATHLPIQQPGAGKTAGSRNDIFSRTFTPTPSPLSPPALTSALPDKPRLAGVAAYDPSSGLPGRERSLTEPSLLPSALALDGPPRRRIETLDVLPARSDSLRPPPPASLSPTTPHHHQPLSPTSYAPADLQAQHVKSPSGASVRSVSSSKTSSFFDSPRAVTTPPPPPRRQPSTLAVRPGLPARTSSYQSAIPPPRSVSSSSSVRSPCPSPASPPLELLELTASLSTMAPPPPLAALRLSTAPSYLLGTGLTSSVYLASACTSERRDWTLCAAKVLSDESGVEGQQALAREEKVLRWLGAGRSKARQGVISYVGAIGVVQTPLLPTGAVRATRRRTISISTAMPFETFSAEAGTLINDVLGAATRAEPTTVLLLEYCPFGTLDEFVQSHPELVDEALFVRWVGDLARGGEWLQARGVVRASTPTPRTHHHHRIADMRLICTTDRDIKPQNILLSATLEPRLTDFGNSLVVAADSPLATFDVNLSGAGTLPYSSPELLQAPTKASHPADLFSLGCTLYVVLNGGKEPFRGVSGTREMVFWVSGAKFWEFEERARAASFGEGLGSAGFRRGRSLREPGKGADKAEAAMATGEPATAGSGAASLAPAPILRKPGSWECLRTDKRAAADGSADAALAASQKAWWKSRRSAADEGVKAGQRATRRRLELSLTVPDESSDQPLPLTVPPPQDHLLHLLSTSPTFAPLALPTLHPPAQIHGPSSVYGDYDGDDDDQQPPLPGPPMFFPASTPYQPLQVPESLRHLLRRMLLADPHARGSMRDVRRWAAAHGWLSQRPAPKDE
jgi:hypothetical protein